MEVLTDEQIQNIAKVNEIVKELIPYNERLKEFGLCIDLKEIKPKWRFQEKIDEMLKQNNA